MKNKSYIVINGKRAELTEEQLKQLGLTKEPAPSPYQSNAKEHWGINRDGEVQKWGAELYTPKAKENYNAYDDPNFAQQVAWYQELNRRLWNFSYMNGWDRDKWEQEGVKYVIAYNEGHHCFKVDFWWNKNYAIPTFVNQEIAERAIKEVIEPFMKAHPKFYWGM